ncbi:MAG TPA: TonB-dependent receptor [Allosphingosinicella sp.]|nr:TonB-dependent receptor [Allosphingosinicella sp.]
MRLKSVVLTTTSAAVLTLGAFPAAAQTGPATPPDPTAEAQTTPAPGDGSPQTDDAVQGADGSDQAAPGEEIVVTGLRRSLQTSQNIKRNSDQIVDVIVAEDIGKLPDRTVSEALSRVPGVSVERQVGEAGEVFVRGLRDPATTYNGRDIFTAEARTVAPQDFPAGGVAALEVFKSLTAEQVEGNLAGLINVRSRRPFDFKGLEIAGSLNGTYADRARDVAWNGNILVSNRWDAGEGEFGALLNVSYTELEYLDSARFVSGDFFAINAVPGQPGTFVDNFSANDASTVRVPVGVGLFQSPGKRKRPSLNAALQWRPSPNLEFYVDGLYQGFRREVSDRNLFVPLFSIDANNRATFNNVVLRDDVSPRYAASLSTLTNTPRADGFQAATREKTNTYQIAAGAVYNTDKLRLAVDVARTDSKFDLSIYGVDYAITSTPRVNVVFDAPRGDGGVEFNFANGLDLTDLNNYRYRGFFDRQLIAQGDDYQLRFDGELKELVSFLPSIDFGVRFTNRDGSFRNGERYSPQEGLNRPYGSLPLQFAVGRDGYRGDINPTVRRLNTPTYDSVRGSITELRQLAGFPAGLPPFNPLQSYDAGEKAYTGYGQVNYRFGDRVDGALGVRVVRTEFSLDGSIENIGGGGIQPFEVSNNYTNVLPNASIRFRPTEQIHLRAAYTETRTRPFFGDLNPGLRIDPPGGSPIRTARGGNPFLRPIQSRNYDLSLEYYFASTGFAALALFRRDVDGFIANSEQIVDLPGLGQTRLLAPFNLNKGRLQGVEAQFRTFFDFLPSTFSGFGTELNFTYIDNDANLPDVSKYTYNVVGFYEKGPITARVAYNRRSRYSQGFFTTAGGERLSSEFVAPVTRLDASISYTLFENLTVAADVSNLLGKPFRNFRQIEPGVIYPRDVRYEERIYSVGIRTRF